MSATKLQPTALRGCCRTQAPSKYSHLVDASLGKTERRKEIQKLIEKNRPKRCRPPTQVSRSPDELRAEACCPDAPAKRRKEDSKIEVSQDGAAVADSEASEVSLAVVPRDEPVQPFPAAAIADSSTNSDATKALEFPASPLVEVLQSGDPPCPHHVCSFLKDEDSPPEGLDLQQCLVAPPPILEHDPAAEFWHPSDLIHSPPQDGKRQDLEEQVKSLKLAHDSKVKDLEAQVADLQVALQKAMRQLSWHENVRDWVSSVGAEVAPELVKRRLAPSYLRFRGKIVSPKSVNGLP